MDAGAGVGAEEVDGEGVTKSNRDPPAGPADEEDATGGEAVAAGAVLNKDMISLAADLGAAGVLAPGEAMSLAPVPKMSASRS